MYNTYGQGHGSGTVNVMVTKVFFLIVCEYVL
jgi:hypothetical protein